MGETLENTGNNYEDQEPMQTKLVVGEKSPLSPINSDGIILALFSQSNMLIANYNNIEPLEIDLFAEGRMEAGLIVEGPMIAVVMKWCLGEHSIYAICPVDAQLNKDNADLNIEEEYIAGTRYTLPIIVVEGTNYIVKGLRVITLPEDMSNKIHDAAKAQLNMNYTNSQLLAIYHTYMVLTDEEIAANTRLYPCGI